MPILVPNPMIRPATPRDALAIAEIYDYYIAETAVTFEEEPVPASEIARRIEAVQAASLPWLVAEVEGAMVGYTYAVPWKERSAYRFAVEVTAYVARDVAGRGIGSKLYGALLPMLRSGGIHTAMGGIALPNDASVALHEKFGFRQVAAFAEVGFKLDRWIDVGYWQLVL